MQTKMLLRKSVYVILLALFFILWWYTRMNNFHSYTETYLGTEEHEFVAQGDTINAIGLRSGDDKYLNELSESQVGVVVGLYDSDGNAVWEENLKRDFLSTDEFTFFGKDHSKILPISVNKGETYSFYIGFDDATQNNMHLVNVSTMIYFDEVSMYGMYIIILILGFVIMLLGHFLICTNHIGFNLVIPIIILTGIMYTLIAPVDVYDESDGFISSYHVSNVLMHTDGYDNNEKVFVSEDALRNMEATDNIQSLYRFWFDSNYGNDRGDYGSSNAISLYKNSFSGVGLIPYMLPGIGIFIGRILGLCWQKIYLLGKIVNLISVLIPLGFLLKKVKKNGCDEKCFLWLAIIFLPSFVIGSSSYSGTAFYMLLVIIFLLFLLHMFYSYGCVKNAVNQVYEAGSKQIYKIVYILVMIGCVGAVLFGRADELIGRVVGSFIFGRSDIVDTLCAYGIISLIIVGIIKLVKHNENFIKKAILIQLFFVIIMAIDIFSYVIRSGS